MPKHLFLILSLLIMPLQFIFSSDIVVPLNTQTNLRSVYLIAPKNTASELPASYCNAIMDLLTFDFNNNGYTQVIPKNPIKEALASQDSLNSTSFIDEWKKQGVSYIIKIELEKNNLHTKILSCAENNIKVFDTIPLIGNIESDYNRIHQLHDIIQGKLFGTYGISASKIIYTKRVRQNSETSEKWTSELWECDYNGNNARQITSLNSYLISPAYIHADTGYHSNEILYVSYEIGQPKIFSLNLENGYRKRISYLRGNQLMPAISRQRDKIAFISDVTGNPDLFLQTFNPEIGTIGKPKQIFTPIRGTQASPTFSPDGKHIAFVSNKDGSPKIYILNISDTSRDHLKSAEPLLISKINRENTNPSWSPDGTKIVYSAMNQNYRQLWVYDTKSGYEEQITDSPCHKENPSWAANSLHIVFNTSSPSASELYILNLNQKKPLQISGGSGEKRFPSWEN